METFAVKLRAGQWYVSYIDRWYGPYDALEAAKHFAIEAAQIASSQFDLVTSVAVYHPDEKVETVWESGTQSGNSRSAGL